LIEKQKKNLFIDYL